MPEENFKGFIASRHTERLTDIVEQKQIREEAKAYKAISEHGVELSRERAKEIQAALDDAPAGTVLFFGGSSEEQRTKSTTDVYGDALGKLYEGNTDVLVFSQKTIDSLHDGKYGVGNTTRQIEAYIAQNPGKKIIVAYPLFLKEFSLRPDFRKKEEPHHLTDYSNALQPGGTAEHDAVKALLRSDGTAMTPDGKEAHGPMALEVAKNYVRGIHRLREFAEKYAPDRPIMVGFVSHGLILDALTSYLANNGSPTVEAFEETGDRMIQSSELAKVTIRGGMATFGYRGKEYSVPEQVLTELI
jgi:hypothetical protein